MKNDESVLSDLVVMMFLSIYSWAMENRRSSNRFVVEPPAIEAAITGIQFCAGTARLIGEVGGEGPSTSASGRGAVREATADHGAGEEMYGAAEADAIIRAEEAAAAEAARVAAEAAEAARVAAEAAVEPAAAADAGSPGVDVHASEESLCSSPEEAPTGSGRVRAAVRSLEAGVSSETVAVRYGIHDASRGRALERDIHERRRRRARSASCVEEFEAIRPRDGVSDRRRGRRVEWSDARTPAPLHSSQYVAHGRREDAGSRMYIPQFCPPPAFPTGLLGGASAGGEGRDEGRRRRRHSRDHARGDDRSTRPRDRVRSRSPRRLNE